MKTRSLFVGAVALALPFTAIACGGKDDNNSGSRPSVAEIKTQVMKEAGLPADNPIFEAFGDCAAKGIHASDLPNSVLRKLVAGEEAEVDADNKDKYEGMTEEVIAKCQAEAEAAMGEMGDTPTDAPMTTEAP
jgi:hypothetical protein